MPSSAACISLVLFLILSTTAYPITLQKTSQARKERFPSSCDRENALNLVQQQILASRLMDDKPKRIAVLLRSGDLLWPHRKSNAHAIFVEAFDVATNVMKERREDHRQAGAGLRVEVPDERYKVITAIAKRDVEWAHSLLDNLLNDNDKETPDERTKRVMQDAQNLLTLSRQLLPSNQNSALAFARLSFKYPATLQLPLFLYSLGAQDENAANAFYQEALTAYANSPMDQFLYLSSYPFAANRELCEMPAWTYYQVPSNIKPNPPLQRLFVQTLLRRSATYLGNPTEPVSTARFTDADQIWLALTRLQPLVSQSLPELAPAVERERDEIFTTLNRRQQVKITESVAERPIQSFDQKIESADRETSSDRREQVLALAILDSRDEPLDEVMNAISRINDSSLANAMRNWVYFDRAQRAIDNREVDEARKLAAKETGLDERAYLYSRIADELLRKKREQEGRELLEEIVSSSANLPDTEVKVRALLAVAYLFTKIEPNRSIAILSDAVRTINHLESPDFSRGYLRIKIEGKTFSSYATVQLPGFDPENGFRQISRFDFDGALYLTTNLSDKYVRALTILALAEDCLNNSSGRRSREVSLP